MLAQGSGSIVNIASITAHSPQPWSGAYSTAKAGVAMLSRQFAVKWGGRGVRSNAICPGLIRTPLSAAFYADPEIERQRSAMTASRRIGEPQDIADAVLFLASARSSYINGTELVVGSWHPYFHRRRRPAIVEGKGAYHRGAGFVRASQCWK